MNNPSQTPQTNGGTGYLIIKVSTARGAIPLEGASVNIRGATPENSDIIYSLVSNADGLTPKIALPTPLRYLSESPGNIIPYALYNIDVFNDGYADLSFTNVAVFDSITSIQPAVMIPLPDNEYTDSFTPKQDMNPDDSNYRPMGGE